VRQETYTHQNPDGTVMTTTTQVRTKYVDEREFGCGPGTLNGRYCASPPGILRIVEIVSGGELSSWSSRTHRAVLIR